METKPEGALNRMTKASAALNARHIARAEEIANGPAVARAELSDLMHRVVVIGDLCEAAQNVLGALDGPSDVVDSIDNVLALARDRIGALVDILDAKGRNHD